MIENDFIPVTPVDLPGFEQTQTFVPAENPEKKKRGRPKKDQTPKNDPPKKPVSEKSSVFDLLNEIDTDTKGKESEFASSSSGQSAAIPAPPVQPSILSGRLLIIAMDIVFPMLLRMLIKDAKLIKASDMKMSKDQQEMLLPVADEVAKQIQINPVALLLIGGGAIYYQNMNEAIESALNKAGRTSGNQKK